MSDPTPDQKIASLHTQLLNAFCERDNLKSRVVELDTRIKTLRDMLAGVPLGEQKGLASNAVKEGLAALQLASASP